MVCRAVTMGQRRDQLLAGGRVGRIGDDRAAGGEELLFLELDTLPGWGADDAGEAAGPAGGGVDIGGAVADAGGVGELDVPVEEAVRARWGGYHGVRGCPGPAASG